MASTRDLNRADSETMSLPLRFVTAASLFDGHDASINIMRRILQDHGVEVIHLGHNRSVGEVVRAALNEDADGIAMSSYQGGHVEYFKYMVDLLREAGAEHIKIFAGGGGVIVPSEIEDLEAYGIEKIYSPEDGRQLGLDGMIEDLISRTRAAKEARIPSTDESLAPSVKRPVALARMLTGLEEGRRPQVELDEAKVVPVMGITGPGGAGKSSLTDELLTRFRYAFGGKNLAVLSIDPTKRRTGGALLGDRIRMNALDTDTIFMRSMATRRSHLATNEMLQDAIALLKRAGFDLIIVETAGIGQGGSEIVDVVDLSLYVMTSEYGAASQLEKIDMIDYADIIVLNKYEKQGSLDAVRDIRKQWRRSRKDWDVADDAIPVYPTIASQFNDPGVNRLFETIVKRLTEVQEDTGWNTTDVHDPREVERHAMIPADRVRYLSEIAAHGRTIRSNIENMSQAAHKVQVIRESLDILGVSLDDSLATLAESDNESMQVLISAHNEALERIDGEARSLLESWPAVRSSVRTETFEYQVRQRTITGDNYTTTLSHQKLPRVAAPSYQDWGEQLRFLLKENLPGRYPYTAGIYPYKRTGEDPTRMFAGEGMPERTNRRFHYVSRSQPAKRLSTAFDSVTLYGEDPAKRPDIFGKIGNSGVSICSLDDAKRLYSGFDLSDPKTSVSMTINGPAPMLLAFFMNAAIDQNVEKYLKAEGLWEDAQKKIDAIYTGKTRPSYRGELPEGHDGHGLGLLGVTGDQVVPQEVYAKIKAETLAQVRGTVQADILKEDQAQNTCIFSTEFAMRMMGDIQEYFIDHGVRNYYSVSISGYHIAEAGANPITQLALTLANGLTFVEYYLARGMNINDFAPNLSFFFSNGVDPEYAVIGRVARRLWARAMRDIYGANARSQMLKYHIQTSGRSLHAQEIQFNDIRTTLQALYAIYDNCNSLHTNAYDEAITTPTEESVRRALAIQLIINNELGLAKNENPLQGAFIIDELTDLVEEAVYVEFDRLTERGGVLGAMETMYQRGKIQDESMYYEGKKFDGSLPIIGVNTFLSESSSVEEEFTVELIRSTDEEKESQITSLAELHAHHSSQSTDALRTLQETARSGGNVFEALLDASKVASLGQMTGALYEVGGRYRRNL